MKARPLLEIFDLHLLESCDPLKMDCEGCRHDVLMVPPVESLPKLNRIGLEYHDKFTPHKHEELHDFLLGHGLIVQVFNNPVLKNLGYMRAER